MIEHLGKLEKQIKFAKEICRVARKVWVQTPAREFFIEPHLLAPFVHYLPKQWQKKIVRYVTPWDGLRGHPKIQWIMY